MTTSRTFQLVLAAFLAAATMACSGGADADTATADTTSTAADSSSTDDDAAGSGASSGTTTVTIDGLAYEPASVEVAAGTTVEWRNSEDVPHTVTFSTDGVEDSGELAEGDTFSTTFAEAGTFDYICAIHPDMKGSVTVQ